MRLIYYGGEKEQLDSHSCSDKEDTSKLLASEEVYVVEI